MKKFLLIVVIVAAIAVAVAFYLKATTPKTSAGVRFPLTPAQHELLASVPASADVFALVPTAAVVRAKLIANPVTRPPLLAFAEEHPMPRTWMIGDADVLMWRAGKETSYAIHLDPLRAALVRLYLMVGSGIDARVNAGMFLINAGAGQPLGPQRLDELLSLAKGLGPADAIMIEQNASRGAFPPINKPNVSAVMIGNDDIVLVSRAALSGSALSGAPPPLAASIRPRFPRNALLSATFRQPPRIVGDLDRLFLARVSHLLDDGGSLVLYDVNAGTLLPRPNGLIVSKATPEHRATVKRIEEAAKVFGEVRWSDDELLVSFDKESMQKYATDTFVDAQWPSNDWTARLDPKRAMPILQKLGDNAGLRIAAPRIYRSARDLRRWVEYLSNANSVEVAHSVSGTTEEMRVRIASK